VQISFRTLAEDDARAVLEWRYEDPYSFYNSGPDDLPGLLAPENRYYAMATVDDPFIGFCCFGPDARVRGGTYEEGPLDIGIGLRPDVTGRGHGGQVLLAILDFARREFAPPTFRATITTFNQRALRAAEKAGFHRAGSFMGTTSHGDREFALLTRAS
jgi:RimJ/RimL family protein N-acetyltransferase